MTHHCNGDQSSLGLVESFKWQLVSLSATLDPIIAEVDLSEPVKTKGRRKNFHRTTQRIKTSAIPYLLDRLIRIRRRNVYAGHGPGMAGL